jgi:hypothetical protein
MAKSKSVVKRKRCPSGSRRVGSKCVKFRKSHKKTTKKKSTKKGSSRKKGSKKKGSKKKHLRSRFGMKNNRATFRELPFNIPSLSGGALRELARLLR